MTGEEAAADAATEAAAVADQAATEPAPVIVHEGDTPVLGNGGVR